eukprot:scaffold80983_cov57-Phaeocystis_antarctica.AAC.2
MDRTHDRTSFDGALLGGGVLVGLGRMHAHGARPRSMLMVIFSTRYRDKLTGFERRKRTTPVCAHEDSDRVPEVPKRNGSSRLSLRGSRVARGTRRVHADFGPDRH